MKAKVNILAKPHPYIFFTLQLHSMFESYWLYLIATYKQTYLAIQTQKVDHIPRSQAMWEELGSGLRTRLQQ